MAAFMYGSRWLSVVKARKSGPADQVLGKAEEQRLRNLAGSDRPKGGRSDGWPIVRRMAKRESVRSPNASGRMIAYSARAVPARAEAAKRCYWRFQFWLLQNTTATQPRIFNELPFSVASPE